MSSPGEKASRELEFRRGFRTIFAETGHRTLNALLVVSGGAAVSFVTFVGGALKELGVAQRIGAEATSDFAFTMQLFIASVALSVLAHGFTYLSHGAYYFRHDRWGTVLMGVVIALCIACIVTFVCGSYFAIEAFGNAARALNGVAGG